MQCVRKVHTGDRWDERESFRQALDALIRREAVVCERVKILTPREGEVVRLAASVLHHNEIADKLAISEGTVKTHLHHIHTKLQVHSRFARLPYAYKAQ